MPKPRRAAQPTSEEPKRGRGRPPAFDRADALNRAMRLFWDRGYEGTSFEALTEAMGLSASSLQNAFGSKEALFHEAVQTYLTGPTGWFTCALDAPTSTRAAFEALFRDGAATFAGEDFPSGCMISTAATQVGPALGSVRHFATDLRQQSQAALAKRIRRGIAEGDVPATVDPDMLAAFYATVFRGIAVQARDGASRAALEAIGEIAMRCWPT